MLTAQAEQLLKFSVIQVRGLGGVAQPSARVIRSSDEWRKFLAGLPGTPPAVDFNKETVVAIFAGEKPTGGYSVRVDKVTGESRPGQLGRATVHYRVITPPEGAMVTQALTYPYIVIRVGRQLDSVDFQPPVAMRGGPR